MIKKFKSYFYIILIIKIFKGLGFSKNSDLSQIGVWGFEYKS
jgi:hypothetical protein